MSLLHSSTGVDDDRKQCLESTIQRIMMHQKQASSSNVGTDIILEYSSNNTKYACLPQHADRESGGEDSNYPGLKRNGSEIDNQVTDSNAKRLHKEKLAKQLSPKTTSESVELLKVDLVNASHKLVCPKNKISERLKVSLRKKRRTEKTIKSAKGGMIDGLSVPNKECKLTEQTSGRLAGVSDAKIKVSGRTKLDKQKRIERIQHITTNNKKHKSVTLVNKKAKYHCETCIRDFAKKNVYETHLRVHTGVRPFTCNFCLKTFRYKHNLTVHVNIHTGMKYNCSFCRKPFSDGCALRKHLLIHVSDHQFVCDVCNKTFSHQFKLTAHRRQHTGETPFKCTQCDKAYREKGTLVKHLRTHTGETFYNCSECDKKFDQRCHYTAHMRIHTGDLPFQCEFCSRRFRENSQLKRHVKVHSGDRPFRCSVCSRGFVSINKLSEHLQHSAGNGGHMTSLTILKKENYFCEKTQVQNENIEEWANETIEGILIRNSDINATVDDVSAVDVDETNQEDKYSIEYIIDEDNQCDPDESCDFDCVSKCEKTVIDTKDGNCIEKLDVVDGVTDGVDIKMETEHN